MITRAPIRDGILLAVLAGLVGWAYCVMIRMPGTSFQGPLPPLTEQERSIRAQLRQDVEALAGTIGERNVEHPEGLDAAAEYIERELRRAGYEVRRQAFQSGGRTCHNLDVEVPGTVSPESIVVVGAHYDSVFGSPGANDNASGVAAMLALARVHRGSRPARTLRFVAFANEEVPFFETSGMGSLVYAQRSRAQGERIVAMLSLETMGYYSDEPGIQQYPPPFGLFYPSTGNFIAFVSNVHSGWLVRNLVRQFRAQVAFPSEGVSVPASIEGVGWSDHWAFWQQGYPAAMVTDTALYRYPHYHAADDTPEKLEYDRFAKVVAGLSRILEGLPGDR